jgi:hypothetical protein
MTKLTKSYGILNDAIIELNLNIFSSAKKNTSSHRYNKTKCHGRMGVWDDCSACQEVTTNILMLLILCDSS